jgi:hypothetical protein
MQYQAALISMIMGSKKKCANQTEPPKDLTKTLGEPPNKEEETRLVSPTSQPSLEG